MKIKILPLALVFIFTGSLRAQLTGVVNYEQYGISFTIPEGWFGQEQDESVMIQSRTIPGIGVITTHTYTISELEAEAKKGLKEGYGTNMQLQGELDQLSETAIGGIFEGTLEGSNAKSYIIGIENPVEDGFGISIMIATYPNMFTDKHIEAAKKIYQSFTFKKVEKSDEITEWIEFFADVKLTYMDSYSSSSGGGYSSEEAIDLCSKGYFIFGSSNTMTLGGANYSGYSDSQKAESGTWDVVSGNNGNPLLVLTYYNGSQDSYELEYRDNKTYLNGYRYFRTMEGEYAPSCK
ncbi:MAG: hypothetical protein ACMZ7B_07795 [Balneola sp.]